MNNLLHLPAAPLALCDDSIEAPAVAAAQQQRPAIDLRAMLASVGRFLRFSPSLSTRVIDATDRTTITRRL